MDFEKRNNSWTGDRRFFLQTQARGQHRVWAVEVRGTQIFTEWGVYGGSMQNATETATGVNQGKTNAVSPEDYALYLGREKARKKHWEGYREVNPLTGETLDELVTSVDFNNPPLNLCFWKPENTLESAAKPLRQKAEDGKVWYARKIDGLMHCIWTNDAGQPFITSRRMLRQHDLEVGSQFAWDHRFPHIIQRAAEIMPPRSCILGDIVVFNEEGKDDLHLAEGFTKSLTPKALADGSHVYTRFYVWGVAFWDGEDFAREIPLRGQYALIQERFASVDGPFIPVYVITPQSYEGVSKPNDFRDLATKWNWEGWVCVDPDAPMGDRAYNFKGKPDRPAAIAAKVKPEYEDDFVVCFDPDNGIGERSTKDRYGKNGIKSVALYQYNAKGELVYISNCSSGMDEQMKSAGDPTKFPQVWRVVYTNRRYKSQGDKTNAIDFPRVDRPRTDKKPEECISDKL